MTVAISVMFEVDTDDVDVARARLDDVLSNADQWLESVAERDADEDKRPITWFVDDASATVA